MNNIVLSPSTFAFLWDECPRCFWLEAIAGLKRPRAPFPAFFTHVDSTMKRHFADGQWHSVGALSQFRVAYSERMLESSPIILPGRNVSLVIRGRFDSILLSAPSVHLMSDFKCAPVKAEYLNKYSRQLHAYTYAAEKPGPRSPIHVKIDELGLLVFEPAVFGNDGETAHFDGALKWVPIRRSDEEFMKFLDDVAALLEQPSPPPTSPTCDVCQLRTNSRTTESQVDVSAQRRFAA